MKSRRAVLISNPLAGRDRGEREREVARFRQLLSERGVEVELLNTCAPGDATRLARQAAESSGSGVDVIVSGGDGTINEALQGLIGTGARLGIWPRGTANVLARELRLPFGPAEVAEVIARGHSRSIYTGCATVEATGERRHFFLMAGVGLDASVVRGVRTRLKRRVGQAAFWYSGIGHLLGWEPVPFRVEIEGETHTATFAAIGKAPRYGGGLAVTPGARLDEPEFEVCLVNSRSRVRYLHLLSRAMRGVVARDSRAVRFIKTRRVRATGDVLAQVDGELIGPLPLSFEIEPNPIEVIVP